MGKGCGVRPQSLAEKTVNAVSHASSISSAEEYGRITRKRRAAEAVIKELVKNARFTGALLTAVLKELEGESLDDFCRHTGADVLTGNSLRGMATEVGSTYTKDIRLDLVFEYAADDGLMLRINEETQTKQKTFQEKNLKSYSLAARAVYYASLAMATQLNADREYHRIRKVYSVWICYEYPVPEIREPVISYSLRPDREYTYKDGMPVSECRRKFDSGDLMGIVMISVPDVDRIYSDSSLLYSGKYNAEMITVLYFLLSEKTDSSQRKKFYYDRGIIVRGSEEGNTVSGMEEMRMIIEEERKSSEEERKKAEERVEQFKKKAEEEKRKAEEEKRKAEEEKRKAEIAEKRAEEAEKQAAVHATVHIGRRSGLDLEKQISMIAELLRVGQEEAREIYRVYS